MLKASSPTAQNGRVLAPSWPLHPFSERNTRFALIPSYSRSAPNGQFRGTPAFVFCQNIGM
jgi:hypothetical protein